MLAMIQSLGYNYAFFHIEKQYLTYEFYISNKFSNSKEWISHWDLIGTMIELKEQMTYILLASVDEEMLRSEEFLVPQKAGSFISFDIDGMQEVIDMFKILSGSDLLFEKNPKKYFKLLNEKEVINFRLDRQGIDYQKLYRYFPSEEENINVIYIIQFPYWNSYSNSNQRKSLVFIKFHLEQLENLEFRPRKDSKREPFAFSQESLREFSYLLNEYTH